ncbi:hypothetical protein GPX89_19775 [Nocardia sp. ET3-3]|uniref:Uncharacterized protein n=1 Tax=Nocardia terrae TaxID=2675851 RepID=A0A7K1UYK9_9NOCA|nr:hypothetical protein [Nocardia terrae]MVU79474.1 hypothetical protein [Nocardia terrae]
MSTQKRRDRYTPLEALHRTELIGSLRDYGYTYSEIARTLQISLSKVEKCLGEAATLRAQGLTKAEVAELLRVPYGSLSRMLPAAHSATITARQNQVLDLTSDMRGVQVDLIAAYLDVELSTAYNIVSSLIDKGLLFPLIRVGQGRAWAVPKKEAASPRVGWRTKDWAPSMMWANHDRATAQARIMLVGSDPHRWVSERQLRRRAEEIAAAARDAAEFSSSREPRPGRPHIHDGWVLRKTNGELQWWAVEVELTRKWSTDMDIALQGAMRATQSAPPFRQVTELAGLLYLCRTSSVMDGVTAAVGRLPGDVAAIDIDFETRDLDDDWSAFLARRAERKAAEKAKRDKRIHTSKEAS